MKHLSIFAACVAAVFALASCDTSGSSTMSIGSHRLIIINTSGKSPYGGTAGTSIAPDGTETHFFKSANGEFDITLTGILLTINGDKYTLKDPKAAIQLEDGNVLIDGKVTKPDGAP
jgi:hypothetical protein